MPSSTDAARYNDKLDLSGKTAAVAGGSASSSLCPPPPSPLPAPSLPLLPPPAAQGIGAAVGLRFAQAGANVYVIGRNEKLGEDVVRRCRAQAGAAADGKTFEFIKADLSCVPSLAHISRGPHKLTPASATGP